MLILLLGTLSGIAAAGDPLVVGYYMDWTRSSYPPAAIPFQHLTHIAHAFLAPAGDGTLSNGSSFAFPALIQAAHNQGLKVVASVGGWGLDAPIRQLAADTAARHRFVRNLTAFCISNGYDGADIDYEYPKNATDRDNFRLLIHDLRQSFDAAGPSLLLSIAAPGGWWSGQWFDVKGMDPDLAWIGIMTYDYYGNWNTKAGPNAAIYSSPQNDQGWVDNAFSYYAGRGIAGTKLLTGTPFYGWVFNACALYGSCPTNAVQSAYNAIAPKLQQGWTRSWDATGLVPYMINAAGTQLISYDDSQSVAAKCSYIKGKGAGGTIIWALGQDYLDGRQPLLETVGTFLRPVTAVAAETVTPGHFSLSQNYPNPFNGQTTLRYAVGAPVHVRILLYDVLGREIRTLVNADYSPGSYELHLRVDELASGAYFCRMQAGRFVETKRLCVLR